MNVDVQKIGKNIAKIRNDKGYTQAELASFLGVSPQAVSKWETGLNIPEASLLLKLSELFHISIDELLLNIKKPDLTGFMNRNIVAPAEKQIAGIPRISRWNPPEGCDMFYSMPAMITEALCYCDRYDAGSSEPVLLSELNRRFCDVLHVSGIGYGFLWREQKNLIEELWRMNDYGEMLERIMRYYGRDYLWLTKENATPEEMRKLLVWSIDRGHPVVMEWAGGIPEFSIVTGYKEKGNILIGWTYCEECAAKTTPEGMFMNPARWQEEFSFNMLILGNAKQPDYTDKDSIQYALHILDQTEVANQDEIMKGTLAGDAALQAWLADCSTPQQAITTFGNHSIYSYALGMNSIYTQQHLAAYYKRIGENNVKCVNDIVIQIGIAIQNLGSERQRVDQLTQKFQAQPNDLEGEQGAAYLEACRGHIQNILQYRGWMRDWLKQLYALL